MTHNIKNIFFCLAVSSLFSLNAETTTTKDLSGLPALTIQMKNNGLLQTKYAKIQSEENYGLWMAFDNVENTIHYRVIQEPGAPALIDLSTIQSDLITLFSQNKEIIKEYLEEIIDFQELKYYLQIIEDHLQGIQFPTLGHLNTEFLKLGNNPSLKDFHKTYAEVDCFRLWEENKLLVKNEINIWQKKLGLTPANQQEMNQAYQTVQRYIDTHPTNINPQNRTERFSLGLNLENFTDIPLTSGFYPQNHLLQQPYTIQFANIQSKLIKRVLPQEKVAAHYKTTMSVFFYLPPVEEQYAQEFDCKTLQEKIGTLTKTLEEKKRKSILKDGAIDFLKEKADGVISMVIEQIKKHQEILNNELDKICDKVKNFFN